MAGMLLDINRMEAWYQLTGRFNASNLLLVYGVAFLLGKSQEEIITGLTKVGRVPGRFEIIKSTTGFNWHNRLCAYPRCIGKLVRER